MGTVTDITQHGRDQTLRMWRRRFDNKMTRTEVRIIALVQWKSKEVLWWRDGWESVTASQIWMNKKKWREQGNLFNTHTHTHTHTGQTRDNQAINELPAVGNKEERWTDSFICCDESPNFKTQTKQGQENKWQSRAEVKDSFTSHITLSASSQTEEKTTNQHRQDGKLTRLTSFRKKMEPSQCQENTVYLNL